MTMLKTELSADYLYREINEWIEDNDVIPSDWEEVVWYYIAEEYTEERADQFTHQVLDLFGVSYGEKTLQQWLEECPTAWNLEYNEEWGRFCYFIYDPDQDPEKDAATFLESFRVN
tara:strand:+ start:178 stop:525 length:348 start_codon:yes stop_codon:yes gene_type:complete